MFKQIPLFSLLLLGLLFFTPESDAQAVSLEQIAKDQAAQIPAEAMSKAFAYFREHADQIKNKNYITIVDFDLPSTAKRMHVIDLKTGAVEDLLCAHGAKSGEDYATKFSNESGSNMSSLGVYLIDKPTMTRKRGMALLLDGMEPTNDRARRREIIFHGAPYVSEQYIKENGRLGRSLGCPAIEMEIMPRMIKQLQGGSMMLIYHSAAPTTQPAEATGKVLPGEETTGK